MGILMWALFGLVAGALAKFIMPGRDPGGLIVTILLGIVGSVVGGYIGTLLGYGDVNGFNTHSMAMAVGGGILVLFVYRMLTKGGS